MIRALLSSTLVLGFALFCAPQALANVSATVPTNGTSLASDKAQNGPTPSVTKLGNIVILEGANGDFANQTNKTLILTAPAGWQFSGTATSTTVRVSGGGANELSVSG